MQHINTALFILLLTIFSCGGNPPSTGTGSIAFNVQWQAAAIDVHSKFETQNSRLLFAPVDCTSTGVSTVQAVVYSSANAQLAVGGPWNCSAHSGSITAVPEGANYKVLILGKDTSGSVKYRGENTGISVTDGQSTNAGTIIAAPFAPTLTSPSNGTSVTNGSFSFTWSGAASSYQIQVANSNSFSSTTINTTSTVASHAPTAPLTAGTYYWRVKSTDTYGNASDWSSVSSFSVSSTTCTAPSAPTGINAVPGDAQMTINWNSVSGANSYNIYWSTSSGVTTGSGTLVSNVVSPYIHTNRTNGVAMYYMVTAANSCGESGASSPVSATPTAAVISDTTPPTAGSPSPANNAANIAVNSVITVAFSEAMNASTINAATFTVNNGESNITGAVSLNGTTATFTPSADLSYSTVYTATITTGAKDMSGNAMAGNYVWTFTTTGETGVSVTW